MTELLQTLASYVPALIARRIAADPTPITTATAERFPAAVLYADISGFTPLTERLVQRGPAGLEFLTQLLNTYFGQLVDIISQHGGDVVKFAGDALIALWSAGGANTATTSLLEATRLATQCGAAMQRALHDWETAAGIPLSLRFTLAAGEVFLVYVGGAYNRWEFVVAGRPVSEVGAAEKETRPGEVVLAPSAWTLVADFCRGTALADGHVRLEAIRQRLQPGPAPALALAPAMEAGLRAYIPGAILARLSAGQSGWLAELRRVTVLFINLPDLNYTTPLDQAQQTMRALQSALYRFEGSVNKISVDDKGTSLIAVMGLPPVVHEDDPVRGILAARCMLDELKALSQRGAIGVTTGRVFCGSIGNDTRREYTVLGDVVNVAARLMQAAGSSVGDGQPAGGLLCDAATYAAVRDAFAFVALPPLFIKGKTRAVAVYRPGEGRGDGLESTSHRPATPRMVGREAEHTLVTAALQALLRGGAGGAILIEGEAGIGKSRLITDLLEQAQRLGIASVVGMASAIEKSTPYHAWQPIFRQLLQWRSPSQEGEELPQARVQAQLKALLPDKDAEWLRLAPLLTAVLPLSWPDNEFTAGMIGEVRANNTYNLLAAVLQGAIHPAGDRQRPMVLVLEDGHWFDSASWALAYRVLRQVQPLLLVITTRPLPEPQPDEYKLLRESPHSQHVHLDTLAAEEAVTLVRQRLGVAALPQVVADLIVQKAEGHPFFSEELAYALRDAGLIVVENGVCRLAPEANDLSHLDFPNTIEGIITSRIDRLTPQQQLTLKIASVIGRVFAFRILRDIHPIEEDRPELDKYLKALEKLDITLLDVPEPELAYAFKHVITREVAYNLMLFAQRQQLHRAVAEWYEIANSADLSPYYPLLAHHWQQAEEPQKAVAYLEKAGEQALRNYANREAIGFLQQALTLVQSAAIAIEKERLARWRRQLGQAYQGLGQFAEARRHLEQALLTLGHPVPQGSGRLAVRLVGQLGRQVLHRLRPKQVLARTAARRTQLLEAARAYDHLAEVYYFYNDTLPIVNTTLSTLNLAEPAGPSPDLARAYVNWGYALWLVRRHRWAQLYFDRAQVTLAGLDHRPTEMYVAVVVSLTDIAGGRWQAAQTRLTGVRQAAKEMGDQKKWAESTALLADAIYYRADFSQAAQLAVELAEAARRHDNGMHLAWALSNQAHTALRLGQWQQTLDYAQEALALYERHVDHVSEVTTMGMLTLAYLHQGQWPAARAWAEKTAAHLQPLSPPTSFYALDAYAAVAETYLTLWENDSGRPGASAQAAQQAGRALHHFARLFAIGRPRAWFYQGWYYRLAGRPAKARKAWQHSLALARRLDMPYDEGLAHYHLGLYGSEGERPSHLSQAVSTFSGLGAAYDLKLAQERG